MSERAMPIDDTDPDDELLRVVQHLRALADGHLTEAEALARARQLVGSGALDELLNLIDFDVEHEDESPSTAAEAEPTRDRPQGVALLHRALAEGRAVDLAVAAAALHEVVSRGRPWGTVVLIADAGWADDRQAALTELGQHLGRDRPVEFDARRNPYLSSLTRETEHPAAVLDGDLAPGLIEAVKHRGNAVTLIVVPEQAMAGLGPSLAPDLVLSLGVPRPPAGHQPDVRDPLDLPRALELSAERGGDLVLRLPPTAELADLLREYLRLAAQTPEERGREAVQVLRRLSLGAGADAVRTTLAKSSNLDRVFAAREASHYLAWASLYRDAGLIQPAIDAVERAREADGDDHRVRHALAHLHVLAGDPRGFDELGRLEWSPYREHSLARAYRRQGDLQRANEVVDRALARAPDNLHLLIEAALVAGLRFQLPTMEQRFRQAAELAPENGVVLNVWGRLAARTGEPVRGVRLLRRAKALEPWNPRHQLELAHLARGRGLINESGALLWPLLSVSNPVIRRRATIQLAATLLDGAEDAVAGAELLIEALDDDLQADQGSADDKARLRGLRIQRTLVRGNFRQARDLAGIALRADRANPYFLAQSIEAYLHDRDQLESAMADLEKLEQLPAVRSSLTTGAVTATLRARVHLAAGDRAAARGALDEALSERPHDVVLLNTLAGIERADANLERALALSRVALDLDPGNAYTHRGLAGILRELGQDATAARHEGYVALAGLGPARNGTHVAAALDVPS